MAGNPVELLSAIEQEETFARGVGVRARRALNAEFAQGRRVRNWRKRKGVAYVRDTVTRQEGYAEIHWYEAHGIGKVDLRHKRWINK